MSSSPYNVAANGQTPVGIGFALPVGKWLCIAESLYLSDRELDVVRGIVGGETEASIAQRLGLSVHTIHSHLDRIFRKLHVNSRCELVTRVFAEYVSLEPRDRSR